LEGNMRTTFALPPVLVAAVALGGLFAPFAVGGGSTDSTGIAAATERQLGDVAVCHGSVSAGATGALLRLAQTRTEVPQAEMQAALPAAAFAATDPPLWDGLGAVTYKITTTGEAAQDYFNQGFRLTYAFNHGEAQRAFRKAQKLDPDCAMCFWGEALVLGPNINLPMQEDAVAPPFAAAEKARMLAGKTSPREQALIAALTARYAKDANADRAALDAAYTSAMEKVAAQFPDDNDIAVLYAEAVMDLSPWNYWQPGGAAPNPQSAPIVPTLEDVLALGRTALAAQAHSWYPIECCKSKEEHGDCRPVPCEELLEGRHGGVDYRAPEGSKIYVAPSRVHPSPDSKCHICYEPRGEGGVGFCAWLQYGN
jgi:hypothetical protein